jgi:tryptophan 2,3-dioxygenase
MHLGISMISMATDPVAHVRRGDDVAVLDITSAGQVREGAVAARSLDAWRRRWLTSSTDFSSEAARAFPVEAVASHWQSHGRHKADSAAVAHVAAVSGLAAESSAGPPDPAWLLARWLPMLVDVHRNELTYASYVGVAPLVDLARSLTGERVVAAILAELLRHETATWDPAASPVMRNVMWRRRVHAAASAVVQHRPPEADRTALAGVWPVRRTAGAPSDEAVRSAGARLAERVQTTLPPAVVRAIRTLVVPATDVADEIMFLRVLQLFEVVFAGMATSLCSGRDALAAGDTDRATTDVACAANALTRAIPFFRILGTLPVESFAEIRLLTPGASGLQSESFKRIELACAPQDHERMGSAGYAEPNIAALVDQQMDRPSIQELVLRQHPPAALIEAMTSLDGAWAQWKRTHWAIAVRLIGDAAGTGGTSGAAYLRHHVSGRLFPMLHG